MHKKFILNQKQLIEIAKALKVKINEGLQASNQEIRCIPTFVPYHNISHNGQAIVIDFGGTNIRAAIVYFKNGKLIIAKGPAKREIPTNTINRKDFLDIQAELITSLSPPDNLPLGYCFSYPAESTIDGDATLIKWTKEIFINDTIGQKMGSLLLNHLKESNNPVNCTKVAVINDTVASLLAGLPLVEADGYIGLIVGTGNNMATFIEPHYIPKLSNLHNWKRSIPINLESGNFYPPNLSSIDDELSKNSQFSDKPDEQRFEKAVSGAYLAALMKTAVPSSCVEPEIGSKDVVRIAKEGTDDESKLAQQILTRSAKLVAASLAGLIDQLNSSSFRKKICIVAEGSLFWGYDKYHEITCETLRELLDEMDYTHTDFEIVLADNANLSGSAIAALAI